MIKKLYPINTASRKLVPLAEYKGPRLELMFYEKDEIRLLKSQLSQLEREASSVLTTASVNRHLTGYQKKKCAFKLSSIEQSIDAIKERIYNIKKNRFAIQKEEFLSQSR